MTQNFPTPADADRSEAMNPTFTKYYLPDGRVLHHFTAANDADFHDHPFSFESTIGPDPAGGYKEEVLTVQAGKIHIELFDRLPGQTHRVEAGTIHRLTGLLGKECWTVITPGAKEREPGFYRITGRGLEHRFWHEADWQVWPREHKEEGWFTLLPATRGTCEQCATKHELEQPHNQTSLHWQYWFYGKNGRLPVWADAMAHCSPEIKAFWQFELAAEGISMEEQNGTATVSGQSNKQG